MNEQQRFIIALAQVCVMIVAIAAITLLAVEHSLPPGATVTLLGVWLGHAGITAYNGATKAGLTNGNGEKRQ